MEIYLQFHENSKKQAEFVRLRVGVCVQERKKKPNRQLVFPSDELEVK